jgi:hypothetical protein
MPAGRVFNCISTERELASLATLARDVLTVNSFPIYGEDMTEVMVTISCVSCSKDLQRGVSRKQYTD